MLKKGKFLIHFKNACISDFNRCTENEIKHFENQRLFLPKTSIVSKSLGFHIGI